MIVVVEQIHQLQPVMDKLERPKMALRLARSDKVNQSDVLDKDTKNQLELIKKSIQNAVSTHRGER